MDFDEIPAITEEVIQAPVETQQWSEPVYVPEVLPEPVYTMPEPEIDDSLSAFNTKWNSLLEIKKAAETEAENKAKLLAAGDLSNWNSQREIRLASKKDSNRTAEQVFLETINTDIDVVNTWDRVTKLIDASMDASTESNKADVTRMRKLFIQLKNEPIVGN